MGSLCTRSCIGTPSLRAAFPFRLRCDSLLARTVIGNQNDEDALKIDTEGTQDCKSKT